MNHIIIFHYYWLSGQPLIFIVNASFVLRILLQFQRVERRNRFIMFKIAFGSIELQISVFKQFKVVLISNYPYITDLELTTLLESHIHLLVLNFSNWNFCQYYKLQNLTTQPKIVNKEFIFEPETQPFLIVNEAYELVKKRRDYK